MKSAEPACARRQIFGRASRYANADSVAPREPTRIASPCRKSPERRGVKPSALAATTDRKAEPRRAGRQRSRGSLGRDPETKRQTNGPPWGNPPGVLTSSSAQNPRPSKRSPGPEAARAPVQNPGERNRASRVEAHRGWKALGPTPSGRTRNPPGPLVPEPPYPKRETRRGHASVRPKAKRAAPRAARKRDAESEPPRLLRPLPRPLGPNRAPNIAPRLTLERATTSCSAAPARLADLKGST